MLSGIKHAVLTGRTNEGNMICKLVTSTCKVLIPSQCRAGLRSQCSSASLSSFLAGAAGMFSCTQKGLRNAGLCFGGISIISEFEEEFLDIPRLRLSSPSSP